MEDIEKNLNSLRQKLLMLKNTSKAEKEKNYLKSPYKFYGVSVWDINIIVKDFRNKNPILEKDKLFRLVQKLWCGEYHEEKTLALKLLGTYSSYLSLKDMDLLEGMLEDATGWDHVDEIACHLISAVLAKNKSAYSYLKKWSTSDNFWVRRASIISQIILFKQGKGDKELFFTLADKYLYEKEFFIRKAIGWTLRELSKTDPQAVYEYIKINRNKMSRLTYIEGSRRLPGVLRKNLENN